MGASLSSLHVPIGFGGRVGSGMNTIHVFPQGVLAAITLVGGEPGEGRARTKARCEVGLPLCSVDVTPLLGVGSCPKLLEQKPRGSGGAGTALFKCVLYTPPSNGILSPSGEQCWSKRGWCGYSARGRAGAVAVWLPSEM